MTKFKFDFDSTPYVQDLSCSRNMNMEKHINRNMHMHMFIHIGTGIMRTYLKDKYFVLLLDYSNNGLVRNGRRLTSKCQNCVYSDIGIKCLKSNNIFSSIGFKLKMSDDGYRRYIFQRWCPPMGALMASMHRTLCIYLPVF